MWLNRELNYTGGLVLPVGYKLPAEFDLLRNADRFTDWELRGIRLCAKNANVNEKGEKSHKQLTFIVEIDGELKVMNRLWTTDIKPEHEPIAYRRVGSSDDWSKFNEQTSSVLCRDGSDCEAVVSNAIPVQDGASDDAVDTDEPQRSGSDIVDVAIEHEMQRDELPAPARPVLNFCGMVVVIDFMSLLVRAFKAGPPSAIHGVRSMFETVCNVIDRISPEYLIFAMDDPGPGQRSTIYPQYKANRPPKEPELVAQIELGQKALQAIGWPSIRVKGWEADDVLASLAVQLDDVSAGVVLVTSDKDALQTCAMTRAMVYHPWGEGVMINERRCDEKYGVPFSMMNGYLALCGDTSDNIPGVAGIGSKTAATLMRTHRTFEGVLQAAQDGLIKGKVGKSLVEQAEAARLSRDLVTLRTDLPVGDHWQCWPLDEPRAGWQRHLQDLGLGAVAQRLSKRLPDGSTSPTRLGSSHVDIDAGVVHPAAAMAESVPAVISPEMKTNSTESNDVESWYPCLAKCPPNASLLDKVRAVYKGGLEDFRLNRSITNGWKRDCVYYVALDQGLHGQPLVIDLADYDARGVWIDRGSQPPAEAVSGVSVVTKTGALF